MRRLVGYASSQAYCKIADLLPSNIDRASIVSDLIDSFDLPHSCDEIITPVQASKNQLISYHDENFISFLLGENVDLEILKSDDDEDERSRTSLDSYDVDKRLNELYGLEFDCPYFEGLDSYIRAISGTTIACARYLIRNEEEFKGQQRIAINWPGGRHHAHKDKASGFCYINDIILGINELRKSFDKVLYVDLDLHHGDGVEAAFAHSNRVMCVSIHRYDRGFFPGSGNSKFNGKGHGQDYTLNLGLRSGLSENSLLKILENVIKPVFKKFQPDSIVIQCGADGLAGDPTREWNLSIQALSNVIIEIINLGKHTLLVGGGGYNHADTARLWCLTLGRLVKENAKCIDSFSQDGYAFFPAESTRRIKDLNDKDDFLDRLIDHAKDQINKIDAS
ncbi:hypothetical protein V1514DRAFT_364992 [Lipomyces japonicus]|uniref:uncharacterized protein n=1 Tax=Lipomyces japonicus TaxID=56871 RepID=UPI0034CEE8DE